MRKKKGGAWRMTRTAGPPPPPPRRWLPCAGGRKGMRERERDCETAIKLYGCVCMYVCISPLRVPRAGAYIYIRIPLEDERGGGSLPLCARYLCTYTILLPHTHDHLHQRSVTMPVIPHRASAVPYICVHAYTRVNWLPQFPSRSRATVCDAPLFQAPRSLPPTYTFETTKPCPLYTLLRMQKYLFYCLSKH